MAKQDSTLGLFDSGTVGNYLKNQNDTSQPTFMNIGNYDNASREDYRIDSTKWKFKLVWGGNEIDDLETKEVTWYQTSWLTETSITGFVEIGDSGLRGNNPSSGTYFNGLGKSNVNSAVLDGTAHEHGNWWNAVGVINIYNGGIPGPEINPDSGKILTKPYRNFLYIWKPGD